MVGHTTCVCLVNNNELCLQKVVKCHGCDEPYAVLRPLTSCSATLTFLRHEPGDDDGDGCIQQLQSLNRHSNMDSSLDDKSTSEFLSSVLCKMPVLSGIQGMCRLLVLCCALVLAF